MGNIVITKEMVANARTYMPLAEKEKFIREKSRICIDRLEMAGESGAALPPMYKENPTVKARCLMSALAEMYFLQRVEEETPGLMTRAAYDEWAGSHIFGQLERLKRQEPDIKNKIFDMMDDYSDLQKQFNVEIHGVIGALNDPVARLLESMEATTTPEYIEALTKQLTDAQSELETYSAARKQMISDAIAEGGGEEGAGTA